MEILTGLCMLVITGCFVYDSLTAREFKDKALENHEELMQLLKKSKIMKG